MAIEQVARISPQPVDASGLKNDASRLSAAPAATPVTAAEAPGGAAAYGGAPAAALSTLLAVSYESLSLPLPAGATLAKPALQRNGLAAAVSAAYGQSRPAATGATQLVGQRLPPEAIVRAAREALIEAAADSGKTLERFLEEAPLRRAEQLPSQNGDDARFSARTAMLAEDDFGMQALDIYVTRTGARHFEVAVFQRADAAPEGGFPYASAPLSLDRLTIDPFTGQILGCVAMQLASRPPPRSRQPTPAAVGGFVVGVMIALAAIVGVALLASGESTLLAVLLLTGAAVIYFKLSPGGSA